LKEEAFVGQAPPDGSSVDAQFLDRTKAWSHATSHRASLGEAVKRRAEGGSDDACHGVRWTRAQPEPDDSSAKAMSNHTGASSSHRSSAVVKCGDDDTKR